MHSIIYQQHKTLKLRKFKRDRIDDITVSGIINYEKCSSSRESMPFNSSERKFLNLIGPMKEINFKILPHFPLPSDILNQTIDSMQCELRIKCKLLQLFSVK